MKKTVFAIGRAVAGGGNFEKPAAAAGRGSGQNACSIYVSRFSTLGAPTLFALTDTRKNTKIS
jgi:hypothetical protein